MALVNLPGLGAYLPLFDHLNLTPTLTSLLLDAAADRLTFLGRFTHKDRAAKTVNGVGFSFGTVSKGAGSTLKVSLQDIDLTTGPPMREDGTADQTLSIANNDTSFVSNTWYEAGFDGGATRAVTPGDPVAIVVQFDTFVSADTVNIRGLTTAATIYHAEGGTVANLSGSYALQSVSPNVVLRCSDGTYGTIEGAWPCSALNSHVFNVATAGADEYALAVQFPFPCTIDGLVLFIGANTSTDQAEVLLYSGTTVLSTTTVDFNALRTTTGGILRIPIPPQTLSINTLYRLAIRPTGTNNLTVPSFDVNTAAHWQCHGGDAVNSHQWTRVNQGAWGGEVTTRRLFAGVRLSAIDNGQGIILPPHIVR